MRALALTAQRVLAARHDAHRLGGELRQLVTVMAPVQASVLLRQVHHGPTRASSSRRTAQGKSGRESRRCLKRTVARQFNRLLERTATNPASASQRPRTPAAPRPEEIS